MKYKTESDIFVYKRKGRDQVGIRCVVLNQQQQESIQKCGWVPDGLDFIPEKSVFFGAMTEQKKLAAVAIYSSARVMPGEVELVYICTAKVWRGQEIGLQLLKMSEQLLQKRGIRKIYSEWHGSAEELQQVSGYLSKVGYRPTMEPAHFAICPQGHFQNSALEKLQKAQPKAWNAVEKIQDYYDRRLKKLLLKQETTGFYLTEEEFVPELCRFYIEEDEIRAAICMRYRSDGNLGTIKGYISPALKYQYAMTMMIAVLIHDVQKVIKPGSKIYLKMYRKGFFESAKKLFGGIPEDIYFQEYERTIEALRAD